MTRKHGIRPSRRPRKEDPYVTIGNQDKQIKLLIERIQILNRQIESGEAVVQQLNHSLDVARDKVQTCDDLQNIIQRMKGWQDCARELLP